VTRKSPCYTRLAAGLARRVLPPERLSRTVNNLITKVVALYGLFTAIHSASGQTWTQTGPSNWYFQSIASSADGSKLVATGPSGIYTSTNSGTTWIQIPNPTDPSGALILVTLSADGIKIAATAFDSTGGLVYTSTNFGVTWTSNNVPSQNLMGIASSADGTKLAIVAGESPYSAIPPETNGPVYVSTNFGTTWAVSGAPTNYWSCAADEHAHAQSHQPE